MYWDVAIADFYCCNIEFEVARFFFLLSLDRRLPLILWRADWFNKALCCGILFPSSGLSPRAPSPISHASLFSPLFLSFSIKAHSAVSVLLLLQVPAGHVNSPALRLHKQCLRYRPTYLHWRRMAWKTEWSQGSAKLLKSSNDFTFKPYLQLNNKIG